jgi:hypothetical protein
MKRTHYNLLNPLLVLASVLFVITVLTGLYAQENTADTKVTAAEAESVPFLIQHRRSVFSDKRSTWIGRPIEQIAKPASPGSCLGSFDGLPSDGGVTGGAKVWGWAWSTREKKAIDHILLVDGKGIIVGLASGGIKRPDVVAAVPEVKGKPTGWQGYSKYAQAVSAYGLVDNGKKVCQLHGSYDIVSNSGQ